MRIFDLNPSHALGLAIASNAGCPLSVAETIHFRDGQRKVRPLVSVRGDDVFIIAPLHGGALRLAVLGRHLAKLRRYFFGLVYS